MVTTEVFKGKVHESWLPIFESKVGESYISTLRKIITNYPTKDNQGFNSTKNGFRILPKVQDILHPFRCVDLNNVKVVIILPEPMENVNVTGIPLQLSEGPRLRTTLLNIIEASYQIYKFDPFNTFDVSSWMKQGVLLINACMTREIIDPNNHIGYWKEFSSMLINSIYEHNKDCLFVSIGEPILDLPKEANIMTTPNGVCTERDEILLFQKYNLFEMIDYELKKHNESISIDW